MTPFLLHKSEEKIGRHFFILVLQFEKLMETGSLYLRPLQSSFLNLLFWTIHMFVSIKTNVATDEGHSRNEM